MPIKAILGIVSGITQTARDKKNRKKQIKQLDEKQKQLNENYFVQSNQNHLDTGEAKKEITQLSVQKANVDETLNSGIIGMGTSPETEIVKAATVNQAYSDAVGRLAKAGTKKRETLKKEYERKTESIANKKANLSIKKKTLFNQMF